MTFTRPKVGPKVYLSRGPSGHPETFDRDKSDLALVALLGLERLHIAIEGLIRKMHLERKLEGWCDVIEYLAEMSGLDIDLIPIPAAVAFWAALDRERVVLKAAKVAANAHPSTIPSHLVN